MNLTDRLLLAPINNLNGEDFRESFQKIKSSDRKFFFEKIIYDKYSPIFLNYINNYKLEDLFKEKELNELKNQSKRFQIQNLQIIKEIIYLNQLLRKEKLNPIFLKGSAIFNEYEDVSLRPMVDIDILIEEDRVFNAYHILKNNNFNELRFKSHSLKDLERFSRHVHHLPELVGSSGISIELHHRVTQKKEFENCPLSEKIVFNKRCIDFFGEKINVPSIDDMIVHQLIHFSLNSKFIGQLRIFSDLKQIEKNHKVDWYKIFNDNKNKDIRRAISLSLEILNYNFPLTNNFNNIKHDYKRYFPNKKSFSLKYNEFLKIKKNQLPDKAIYKMRVFISLIKKKKFSEFLSLIIDWIIFKLISIFKLKK